MAASAGSAAWAFAGPGFAKVVADLEAFGKRWPLAPWQPRLTFDVRAAASFVLSEALPELKTSGLADRLAALPKDEFSKDALTDLPKLAELALSLSTDLAAAESRADAARLPEPLLVLATEVRRRMLRVIEYVLADDESAMREANMIRQGQGYLDLAQDLLQLARLYQNERPTLAKDALAYSAKDGPLAEQLSVRIFSELRKQDLSQARESVARCAALLLAVYEDVAETVRWLLRKQPDAARKWPSLYVPGRTPRRKKAPTPPPTP